MGHQPNLSREKEDAWSPVTSRILEANPQIRTAERLVEYEFQPHLML
jgi:hypothetical protein